MFGTGSTARERFTSGDIPLVLCWCSCCRHDPLIPGILELGKPSFSALVMFDVSEAATLRTRQAEIKFLDVLIFPQRSSLAVKHDPARLEDVAISRIFQRNVGILLGKEK